MINGAPCKLGLLLGEVDLLLGLRQGEEHAGSWSKLVGLVEGAHGIAPVAFGEGLGAHVEERLGLVELQWVLRERGRREEAKGEEQRGTAKMLHLTSRHARSVQAS